MKNLLFLFFMVISVSAPAQENKFPTCQELGCAPTDDISWHIDTKFVVPVRDTNSQMRMEIIATEKFYYKDSKGQTHENVRPYYFTASTSVNNIQIVITKRAVHVVFVYKRDDELVTHRHFVVAHNTGDCHHDQYIDHRHPGNSIYLDVNDKMIYIIDWYSPDQGTPVKYIIPWERELVNVYEINR